MSDEQPPRRLSEALDHVVGALGAPRSSALHTVFVRWPDVVGPAVAAHAQPLSLKDHTLTIGVEHPAWATQLRFLGDTLLRQLASEVGEGEVTKLEIRVLRR